MSVSEQIVALEKERDELDKFSAYYEVIYLVITDHIQRLKDSVK